VANESEERASAHTRGETGPSLDGIDSVREADERSFAASDAPSSCAGGGG